MFLYADDAKLFSNNAFSLQQGLDKFTSWLQLHLLDRAVAKCEHLCISRIHCSNSFFAGLLNIKTVSVVKDLGVYISDNLNPLSTKKKITHIGPLGSNRTQGQNGLFKMKILVPVTKSRLKRKKIKQTIYK